VVNFLHAALQQASRFRHRPQDADGRTGDRPQPPERDHEHALLPERDLDVCGHLHGHLCLGKRHPQLLDTHSFLVI
jgi:hypothetical protein